ncbi:WD40/YVTN/BNR-like repeat-containing protein [Occallatibacter riparius]|uniref:Glycosyl hydrolase n=1 Tax=Occallatibacter riparius TaxID=1002689 RepID=A0A9J7BLH0_9BACT|nr:hypothetical protein [Occallatibacter riparius]UWZ83499.1 hypothetical protein MOP44_23400 [Occallatibacter riparius]
MRTIRLLMSLVLATPVAAQWQMQTSNTTADLRGIHNVGNGVAWASGTNGTVLRTEDGGYVWQTCAIPPGAEKLDFRGIQAFDANTAIVMSSGKGDLSRLYKTTDGCHTWKLIFTNPDKDGFWDALMYEEDDDTIFILGDPVHGKFRLFSQQGENSKFGDNWNGYPISAIPGQAAFAASNSLLVYNLGEGMFSFITGGSKSEIIHEEHGLDVKKGLFSEWSRSSLPFASGDSSGAFSVAARPYEKSEGDKRHAVVVGGDYQQPDATAQTAAYSDDWGYKWSPSQTPPHGYRSSVAYDEKLKTWITVGPNGTDISSDDGKNWRAIHPNAALHEPPDADRNWNAISLPYVVGPKGRIGKLDESALK